MEVTRLKQDHLLKTGQKASRLMFVGLLTLNVKDLNGLVTLYATFVYIVFSI